MSTVVDYNSFELNDVPRLPAPWNLTGQGLIVVLKNLKAFMVVDYQSSDCGPYQELLHIPGRARFAGQRRYTIDQIYVSSLSSVVNGRNNWGIPKHLAHFERSDQAGLTQVRVFEQAGPRAEPATTPFFDIAYSLRGPELALSTAYLPGIFTKMAQTSELGTFFYQPFAQGRMRLAKIHRLQSQQAQLFPAVQAKDVLMAFGTAPFQMVFPVPEVRRHS